MTDPDPDPGLIFVQARIFKPDILSPSLFDHWYNTIHIRDLLATGAITSASRYTALPPSLQHQRLNEKPKTKPENPYITLYPLISVSGFLADPRPPAVPVHDPCLPGPSHYIWDFVAWDVCIYDHVSTTTSSSGKVDPAPAPILLAIAFSLREGVDQEQFTTWLEGSHIKGMEKVKGWKRTRRYTLKMHVNPPKTEISEQPVPLRGVGEKVPGELVLHEFDGEGAPWGELERVVSEGEERDGKGRRMMGSLVGTEVLAVKLLNAFGDVGRVF